MLVRGESMKDAAIRWLPDQVDELRSVVIAPPTQVFDTSVQIDLGSKSVTLAYHGLGHTDSDVAISVDGHDVTFLGDLVEEGSPPYFDDGYPLVWPLALGSALAEGAGIVVPGHGDVMSRAMTLTQLEELESVASIARSCIDDGVPVNEAAAMGPYPDEVMLVALTRALETGTQLS
jgi:glyoxylase-like metal-dependent hydrolase (beta-lactamase superfamily II)